MIEERFAGCLPELGRRQLLPAELRAALLVGSMARGWDNSTSDYDINLICAGEMWPGSGPQLAIPLDPPVVTTELLHADGRRWEVKYWLDSQVDQMLDKVTWERFEQTGAASEVLSKIEELFLERLVTCVPLAGGDWLAARRAALEATAFRAIVVTRSLEKADNAAEDALGQLAADDIESAVLSARQAFSYTADALLESLGQYGSHTPKWRARRFRAAAPAVLSFTDYWAIETMTDLRPGAERQWVSDVVTTCKNIAMKVEI
ncbi:hypothetical protein QQG74_02435 [Micromonospora sp. FIMYZ51]|uniref:hypothetical protein n=1 Tax=Micromonospora sp. FIMYZ51 TaxID=3051832 RepID=UPI00311E2665